MKTFLAFGGGKDSTAILALIVAEKTLHGNQLDKTQSLD